MHPPVFKEQQPELTWACQAQVWMPCVVSGALGTAFYLWRRNLLANIIARVATDFIGIVLPSLLAGKFYILTLGRVTTRFIFNHSEFCITGKI